MRLPLLASQLLACLLLAAPALADDWPGPQTREVFSESRDFFVRVIPGKSIGDSVGFRGMQKGPYAAAEFYRRQPDRSYRLVAETRLKNPMAPLEFFVSNEGRLATLDNWHNKGQGQVVALYDATGNLVRSWELPELFPAEDLKRFERSTTSVEWRDGPAYIRGDQKTLLVTARSGGDFLFSLESGEFRYCEYPESGMRCRGPVAAPPKR